jgi:PPK2 family polyphosphate:nucleotide phosphotransferase
MHKSERYYCITLSKKGSRVDGRRQAQIQGFERGASFTSRRHRSSNPSPEGWLGRMTGTAYNCREHEPGRQAEGVMAPDRRVKPGTQVRLKDFDTADTGKYSTKKSAQGDLDSDRLELSELQERLYAEDKRSLLIVLQGMDTCGKDGTIQHVMSGVNPQGVSVTSFKVPSLEELAHDYLWRIHLAAPPRRMIGIFNRSHYEDVLVVRVHGLIGKKVCEERFAQINAFEDLLTRNGTTILKFFLHISKEEQKKRLQSRLDTPSKQWKFNVGDLKERDLWDQYQAAFEDALSATSTDQAPWYIVPSDHKWYRNQFIGHVLLGTLKKMNPAYPAPAQDLKGIKISD